MYYTLTKKQFNKYEREFRKTYIGKKYYRSYLVSYIISPLFFLGMMLWTILNPNASDYMDMTRLTYVLVMVSFLIGGTIIWIHYMRELKGYIITKTEK